MGCVVAIAYGGKDCLVWAKKKNPKKLNGKHLSSAETEQGKCLLPQAEESLILPLTFKNIRGQ